MLDTMRDTISTRQGLTLQPLAAVLITGAVVATLGFTHYASWAGPSPRKPSIVPLTKTWEDEADTGKTYPRTDFGGALRLRFVDLAYAEDLGLGTVDDQGVALVEDPVRQFVRVRSNLWLRYDRSPSVSIYGRLNNESTAYLGATSLDNRFDEVIVENLFIEARDLFGLPMAARLGRQDLFYGDGFVVADGTPLDQSRTSYVNGLLLTSLIPSWSFDAFVLWNRRRDEYLPRINNKYTQLLEFNEIVAGIVLRRLLDEAAAHGYTLEHYYIFKEEKGSRKLSTIHTLGTRLALPLSRLNLSAELAYQSGEAPEYKFAEVGQGSLGPQTIFAYGIEARAATHTDWPLPLDLSAGYIHLSGDDPITQNKHEGWNPILARWPNWSELYVYTLDIEAGLQPQDQGFAFWQNLKSYHAGLALVPNPKLKFEASHMWLSTSQHIATVRVEADPQDRGRLLILKLSWKPFPWFFGHLLYESFTPGNLYREEAKDASLLRLEIGTSM
jgi:hypothetical protein